jgi:hypothetical protein
MRLLPSGADGGIFDQQPVECNIEHVDIPHLPAVDEPGLGHLSRCYKLIGYRQLRGGKTGVLEGEAPAALW